MEKNYEDIFKALEKDLVDLDSQIEHSDITCEELNAYNEENYEELEKELDERMKKLERREMEEKDDEEVFGVETDPYFINHIKERLD